ncbi:hypothetical protein HZS_1552, partial [Henneguya salminicola]
MENMDQKFNSLPLNTTKKRIRDIQKIIVTNTNEELKAKNIDVNNIGLYFTIQQNSDVFFISEKRTYSYTYTWNLNLCEDKYDKELLDLKKFYIKCWADTGTKIYELSTFCIDSSHLIYIGTEVKIALILLRLNSFTLIQIIKLYF